MKPNLTTKIGKLTFKNPVTVASGTFGSIDEYSRFFSYEKLGAVITKTVTRKPRGGNRMPRVCETPSGMLNSIGLQNKGIDDFIKNKVPYFRKLDTHLIVNIAGETVADFVYLARLLGETKGVSALELNLSCPNVAKGLEFGSRPSLTSELVKAVKGVTELPIFSKLSPESEDFHGVIEAAIMSGSDGLSLINTIRGMAVNIETRNPRLANVMGGLSGPAIKPIALRYVYEVKSKWPVPVIAMGGVLDWRDALEFIIVGADLVAVGTANFVNPNASIQIIQGIQQHLTAKKIRSISELRGTLQTRSYLETVGAGAG